VSSAGALARLPGRCPRAALAQSVEHLTRNEKVVGSIPTGGSTYPLVRLFSEAGDARG